MKITSTQYETLLKIDNVNLIEGCAVHSDYDEETLKSLYDLGLISFNGEYVEVTNLGCDVVSGDAAYEITKAAKAIKATKDTSGGASDTPDREDDAELAEQTEYVLESGIEPAKVKRKKRKERFPLSQMKEGESFTLIPAGETNDKLRVSALNSVNYYNKHSNSDFKFKVGFGPSGETRIFCLKK